MNSAALIYGDLLCLYSNAVFFNQTCNMHPLTLYFQKEFSNKGLEVLIICCVQGCFICRYFVSGPKALQSLIQQKY